MRIDVAIVLLIALVAFIVYATFCAGRWLWRRRRPWSMVEESDGEWVSLYANRPDSERLLIAAVSFSAADFDSQIYEARAEARAKLYALNAGLRGRS